MAQEFLQRNRGRKGRLPFIAVREVAAEALMPVGFANAVDQLPALAEHLDFLDELDAPRQVAALRETELFAKVRS